jgi:peroxiredoxin Q/BCP
MGWSTSGLRHLPRATISEQGPARRRVNRPTRPYAHTFPHAVSGRLTWNAYATRMPLAFLFILFFVGVVLAVRTVSKQWTDGKLKLGDSIPAIKSEDQDGKPVDLAVAGGNGYTLVYFYPKAMTPGCTAQACSLRDAYSKLQNKGVGVFGVSLDKVAAQKKFREREHLPFELLSDRDRRLTAAFGVPLILGSFATRRAYLFKDGKLVWMDTRASTGQQAQDVLAFLAACRRTASRER